MATETAWPEWAQSDDGEYVWVREDLVDRAAEVARPAMETLDPDSVLVDEGVEDMWLDVDERYDGGWLLCGRGSRDMPELRETREYRCFVVAMKGYMAADEQLQTNGTYSASGGAS